MHDGQLLALLEQIQLGDINALDTIYRELSTPVYTVILRLTGNATLSEDILQEFFVKLYHSPPAVIPKKPRTYLFQMAHNLTIDHLRKERPAVPLSDYAETICTTEFPLWERLDLERAISKLNTTDREIVTLHAGAGLTFREVSAIISMPLGTVLWRYQGAIRELRELLNGGTL